ncbi:hypothetical protein CFE70_006868 [Pyrenophora teres f. teres 0-1]
MQRAEDADGYLGRYIICRCRATGGSRCKLASFQARDNSPQAHLTSRISQPHLSPQTSQPSRVILASLSRFRCAYTVLVGSPVLCLVLDPIQAFTIARPRRLPALELDPV